MNVTKLEQSFNTCVCVDNVNILDKMNSLSNDKLNKLNDGNMINKLCKRIEEMKEKIIKKGLLIKCTLILVHVFHD